MGFFSWWTRAYRKHPSRPIYNAFLLSKLEGDFCRKVWMHVPTADGKLVSSHLEEGYKGYGVFGGVDYYVALSKCNPERAPANFSDMTDDEHRSRGIEIQFSKVRPKRFPVFTESKTYKGDFSTECQSCVGQGYWLEECDMDSNETSEE